jgi:hypothetical protein
MSSTLREASKDTLQVKDKTWHYYSLPLAEKELGDQSTAQVAESADGEPAALAGR